MRIIMASEQKLPPPPPPSSSRSSPSIKGCGGILSTTVNDQLVVALVFGKKHQKWSFPKGHLHRNEAFEECAYREIQEETGIRADQLPMPSGTMQFTKTWFLRFDLPNELPLVSPNDHEVQECRWMTREDVEANWDHCNSGVRHFFSKRLDRKLVTS